MRTRWFWAIAALASAAIAQTGPGPREGKYRAEAASGTASLGGSEMLRIATRAAVTLRGEQRADIAYTIRKRTGAEAREGAGRSGVKTVQRSGWAILEISGDNASELQLRVPRTLRRTVIDSVGEFIQAYDLAGGVEANSRGAHIELDRIGGPVVVHTGGGQVRLASIAGPVQCYSNGGSISARSLGGAAVFNTQGGEITIADVKGAVQASTGGGNIRIERAEQTVHVSTGGGLIDVSASGPVVAQAGNGGIRVRAASTAECQSGMGTIQLQGVSGGVRAATSMGNIVADLVGPKLLRDSVLSTSMGDITVYIPSNFAVTVQAETAAPGGHIVSDFPEIRPKVEVAGGGAQAAGSIHGGGPTLRLAATGGTIYLRRER